MIGALGQVAAGLVLTVVVVLIHAFGSGVFLWQSRRNMRRLHHARRWTIQAMTVLALVMGLIGLHAIEIGVFAAAYVAVGAFSNVEAALYFSTASYATVGDATLNANGWRLLGAWEGLVGFVLIGWSTALFITTIHRIWTEDHSWFDVDD